MAQPRFTRREVLAIGGLAVFPHLACAKEELQATPFIRGVAGREEKAIVEIGESFRSEFGLPGVSLAMAHRGKLKLLACFGFASKEDRKPVRPTNQFRIASVSKPITSVAVLRLMEQKQVSLDEEVFAKGGHLSRFESSLPKGEQKSLIQRITIRHLLEHSTGGWSNERGVAPMFATPALGMSHDELIRWKLQNRPIDSEPGTSYAYSNFGYCLLGRVIEAVTGKGYEEAVKELVLDPVGADSTFVGKHKSNKRRVIDRVRTGRA